MLNQKLFIMEKLTQREVLAFIEFGRDKCIEAYKANEDGEGANNIGLDILGLAGTDEASKATMWGDRAIDAGRKMAVSPPQPDETYLNRCRVQRTGRWINKLM